MNPAALLHDLLTQYREPADAAAVFTRWHIHEDAPNHVISDDDRASLLDAARWLIRIDQLITDLDETGGAGAVFRKYYPIWVNSVFAIGRDWTGHILSGPMEVCPDSAMDILASLAAFIDQTNRGLAADAHVFLTELVNEITPLIDEDDTLSTQLRGHLHRVVDHLAACLATPETFDPRDFTIAIDDVVTAVKAAAAETKSSEHTSRWESIRDKFVWPTASAFVASAPGLILQITSGL